MDFKKKNRLLWEAIGVVSYLLINFYFTRIQANKAAILAFTMNRQGDMLISIGFFAIFALFGSLNYSAVFSLVPYMNETAISIIALLLFGGACAKSAQIPLHSWLPGSMEAKANLFIKNIYLLIYLFITFEITKAIIVEECNFISLNILCSIIFPTKPELNKFRDSQGRFRSPNLAEKLPLIELTPEVMNPLIGNLLGDGHLRFTHKDLNGKPKLNTNALYAMTLKNKDYIYHLWKNIYSNICTFTPPRAWPNPKTGKPITQYSLNTKSLPSLTLLHSQWYEWSEPKKKFIKIVPKNVEELLTPSPKGSPKGLGLTHWIMDDGYSHSNGVILATESFSLNEVELLKRVLESKFDLKVTIQNRNTSSGIEGNRLRISSQSRDKLLTLTIPYFIPSMIYKLSL